jgi:hypothetical protein
MPNVLTWTVGSRNPSITETITIGGIVFDLTTSTVRFKAREIGSTVLLVDQPATIVSAPAGTVRYDWGAADITSGGIFFQARNAIAVWWEVTTAGKVQDMMEAIIQCVAHAPVTKDYIELGEFKATATLQGQSFADMDIKIAIASSSRAVDEVAGRRFYLDADAAQVRYYSPTDWWTLHVDDIVTITTLKSDESGDGTFENTWTLNTDYVREPLNAASDLEPWTKLCAHPNGGFRFPINVPRSVELTGKFGWPVVPPQIKQATTILAQRLLKRAREVPFGVSGVGLDGSVVRIMAQDPDVMSLVAPFSRAVLVA